ncbi:DUF1302 family protein [Caballeronia sp. LZ025]|uniref:DUF1302 domain-containing protein n=1 Tax=Caballeronia TaxID=1827195 RepID=UPI001FCFA24D|nr:MULTISPECIES: DUF1302 family protein [Caballeronia]MDR5734351.1 DUF1302 family protein [Caballeronia sp. LZ025]
MSCFIREENKKPPRLTILAGLIAAVLTSNAYAFKIDTPSSDWEVNWDNTVTYTIGMRARGIDPLIGNNPNFDDGDYKFRHAGDIVTNRVSMVSEFTAAYKGYVGFKLSGSAWKDFAYGSGNATNPGVFAPAGGGLPAVTYQSLAAYPNRQYGSFTNRYYVQGAQLLDGFAFLNADVAGKAVYVKAGQFTEYWGNSLLFPFAGISVAQGALDSIKGLSSPGTQTKELLLPRPQVSVTAQVTPEVSLSGQYALGWTYNRLATGGTYLQANDSIAQGPSGLLVTTLPGSRVGRPGGWVPVFVHQGPSITPPDIDNNFGVKLGWTPSFLSGQIGFYYRRFDESQPWVLTNWKNGLPTDYRLAYNRGAQLFGISMETTIGNAATGFEASWRRGTALNTALSSNIANQTEGATGDVLNLIANAIIPLPNTPFWQTGSLTTELAYSHLLSVRNNAAIYNGVGYRGCPSNNKWNGCSTRDYVGLGMQFNPQWLQVFPGVDLSMPTSMTVGLYGNNPQNPGSSAAGQGFFNFSVGLQALVRQKATVTLAFNGYHAHVNGTSVTPSGLTYASSGSGLFDLNDRPWVSLTVQSWF